MKKKFSKNISKALVIIALIFSSHINATTVGGDRGGKNDGKHGSVKPDRNKPKGPKVKHKKNKCGPHGRIGCHTCSGGGTGTGTSVPLDGGLSILVLGAAAFGIKKLRGNKNDKN